MTISKSINFNEARHLLEAQGFYFARRKGSHCMFKHPDGRRFLLDVKVGRYQDRHALLNFIRDLKRALRGERTMLPRHERNI